MDRCVLSWSGGKDSTMALAALRSDPAVSVTGLLTTVAADTGRTRSHWVRPGLIEDQAAALGLPVEFVELPADASNEEYRTAIAAVADDYAARGVDCLGYADLFLEGIREFREATLAETPLSVRWPLWGRDTSAVATSFLDSGYRARIVRVDGSVLDRSYAGRAFDRSLLSDLPPAVDPCGERGAFHTFVYDGPTFETPVGLELGAVVTRREDGREYHYRNLHPADE